jgi:hypothetical protein
MTTVTTVSAGKSKPLPVFPPEMAYESRSHAAPWEDAESPKMGFSLVEAGLQPAQVDELDAPNHVRKLESRERLVGKVTRQ